MPGQAAIVSPAVARGAPVLRAVREKPVEEADSGWSLYAGGDTETAVVRIWSLDQVAAREPSLAPHLDLPPGTVLERSSTAAAWHLSGGH